MLLKKGFVTYSFEDIHGHLADLWMSVALSNMQCILSWEKLYYTNEKQNHRQHCCIFHPVFSPSASALAVNSRKRKQSPCSLCDGCNNYAYGGGQIT
jgi:hypothetical protein